MVDRTLIVNADDLGMTEAVNAGIAAAFERGIVTSASLMVRQAAAPAGAAYAKAHPGLAVGLHIDLGQWDYENGEWIVAYEQAPAGGADPLRPGGAGGDRVRGDPARFLRRVRRES
jgi:hypothetical protein